MNRLFTLIVAISMLVAPTLFADDDWKDKSKKARERWEKWQEERIKDQEKLWEAERKFREKERELAAKAWEERRKAEEEYWRERRKWAERSPARYRYDFDDDDDSYYPDLRYYSRRPAYGDDRFHYERRGHFDYPKYPYDYGYYPPRRYRDAGRND